MRTVLINGKEYRVDELDRIVKRRGKGFVKSFPDKDGYLKYAFTTSEGTYNIPVHKFVWELYNGLVPEGFTIDHKDNDKQNNHIDNLQLLSPEDNARKGNARYWVLIDPFGIEHSIYNLQDFCRNNGFHKSHFYTIAKGNGRVKSCKGWKCYERN